MTENSYSSMPALAKRGRRFSSGSCSVSQSTSCSRCSLGNVKTPSKRLRSVVTAPSSPRYSTGAPDRR